MRDKSLLHYDDPVSKHWPEFAQNGKESVTIAQVCRHEAGLQKLPLLIPPEYLLTENIKLNKVGELFEKAPLIRLPHGMERSYHTFSQDLILNEIFRRVEPHGRTMAEYFEQELTEQFGFEGVYLRMNENELKYVYDNSFVGFRK